MLKNFRVYIFCVKIFPWSRIPTKIFWDINRLYVSRFSDQERSRNTSHCGSWLCSGAINGKHNPYSHVCQVVI